MKVGGAGFNRIRVFVAVIVAEMLPILLLFVIVFIYGFIRQKESLSPHDFAPLAGNWVGPIGGFLATLLFAWWAARRATERKFLHGTAVGVGTALLDLGLGILLAGAAQFALCFSSRTAEEFSPAYLAAGWRRAARAKTRSRACVDTFASRSCDVPSERPIMTAEEIVNEEGQTLPTELDARQRAQAVRWALVPRPLPGLDRSLLFCFRRVVSMTRGSA